MKPHVVRPDPSTELATAERCSILESWNSPEDGAASVARARVEPGVRTRLHRLRDTVERYVVLEGDGVVEVEGLQPTAVRAGDVVVIPAGSSQRIENVGGTDLVFLCVCTPRFAPEAYEALE